MEVLLSPQYSISYFYLANLTYYKSLTKWIENESSVGGSECVWMVNGEWQVDLSILDALLN
jgi:hypothetical protein